MAISTHFAVRTTDPDWEMYLLNLEARTGDTITVIHTANGKVTLVELDVDTPFGQLLQQLKAAGIPVRSLSEIVGEHTLH